MAQLFFIDSNSVAAGLRLILRLVLALVGLLSLVLLTIVLAVLLSVAHFYYLLFGMQSYFALQRR